MKCLYFLVSICVNVGSYALHLYLGGAVREWLKLLVQPALGQTVPEILGRTGPAHTPLHSNVGTSLAKNGSTSIHISVGPTFGRPLETRKSCQDPQKPGSGVQIMSKVLRIRRSWDPTECLGVWGVPFLQSAPPFQVLRHPSLGPLAGKRLARACPRGPRRRARRRRAWSATCELQLLGFQQLSIQRHLGLDIWTPTCYLEDTLFGG